MMMQSAVDFSDYELIISLDFTIFAKLFVWIVSFLYFCSNPLRKKNWRFGSTAESNRIKDIR